MHHNVHLILRSKQQNFKVITLTLLCLVLNDKSQQSMTHKLARHNVRRFLCQKQAPHAHLRATVMCM